MICELHEVAASANANQTLQVRINNCVSIVFCFATVTLKDSLWLWLPVNLYPMTYDEHHDIRFAYEPAPLATTAVRCSMY
jgi:hypothetical protein